MADGTPGDVKQMSFESAIAELESIVKRLARGDAASADARAIRARSEALKRRCMDLVAAVPGC